MKTALLIIDMQNGCREEASSKMEFDRAVMYINEVSCYFRKKEYPVVVIQDRELGEPGSAPFACVDNLMTAATDIVVYKSFCNAFWKTELDATLKGLEVDAVVVCGFAAEHCVLFTYNGARERGYEVFLLQNGIAGQESEQIRSIQRLRPVISHTALEYYLR